jgi:hypothetical protein
MLKSFNYKEPRAIKERMYVTFMYASASSTTVGNQTMWAG